MPQIGIWTDAWLERLRLLRDGPATKSSECTPLRPPALPLLIAQGHDWHLMIASKDGDKMIVRQQISIGSTRTSFDAMKAVAVLHWLMDWAERTWRPWFLTLLEREART